MNSQLEELYLEAEADIRNSNYAEAFKKYETLLYEEPNNGPTLNSLGWLYKTQIEDYDKAESYYKACIKSNPLYPHTYYNYATLLTDMERFEELSEHLQSCFKVATIEKSWVYMKLGLVSELKLDFNKALEFHERSILIALSDEKIKEYQQNVDRCKTKMELAKGHEEWLAKIR